MLDFDGRSRENGTNLPENDATAHRLVSITDTRASSMGFRRGVREYVRILFPKHSPSSGGKMATMAAAEERSERAAMARFGSAGMALLPRTRQMLAVLWEQLRLLVHVIYYTFVSVFQMFRFEVHVRITDETGQHIQHMTTAANPTESFLFSSLFDGDNGVMVGGSNPLSNFCAEVGDPFARQSTAEALLSTLRADDLCCGLVDDFVSRTAGDEDGIFLGHQSAWTMGFPGDWNIFVSSSDSCGSNDACQKNCEKVSKREVSKERVFKHNASEEERSCHWSSEEDQNVEFDSEESKALWESLSKSSDPYNPFFFTACISTSTNMGKGKAGVQDSSDTDFMSVNKASEEVLAPQGFDIRVSRSDSESSWSSWASSDGSSSDIDKEENEKLWEMFNTPEDPYNPMCFTACAVSKLTPQTDTKPATVSTEQASHPAPAPRSDTDTEKGSSFLPSSDDDDDDEQLWKSLCHKDDPFHPLNFQARLQSSPVATLQSREEEKTRHKPRVTKPFLPERQRRRHSHPDHTVVPWKRPGQNCRSTPEDTRQQETHATQKKVRFSPVIQVHVMRTWLFARRASRRGDWEEAARDWFRFQKRIWEMEQLIGYCFTRTHREKIRAYLDGALK